MSKNFTPHPLSPTRANLAILISGRGSNMQSIVEACESGQLNAQVSLVASNNPEAVGLEFARAHSIQASSLDHRKFSSREAFEDELAKLIDSSGATHLLLAGFMRILGAGFVERYQGRILNIHPSLLPAYPGLETHERALSNGDSHAGASVHFVTRQLDGGPVILQARVPIAPNDTPATLSERVLQQEHRIYPQAIEWVLNNEMKLENGHCFWRGKAQLEPIIWDGAIVSNSALHCDNDRQSDRE